ncbi:MAG: hypothetical protein DRI61_16935, partial [Chloroflexi bacterium]
MRRWVLLGFALLLGLLSITSITYAWGKSLYWKRLDVDITVLPNSDIRIVETWDVVFEGGPFRYGYRFIPMDKLVSITDVAVEGPEGPYAFDEEDSEAPHTFSTEIDEGDFIIWWYFPPIYDEEVVFRLAYTVKGGLRFYEDGDQLWWKAVFPYRDYPVLAS